MVSRRDMSELRKYNVSDAEITTAKTPPSDK
jgi:hypothetical protein